MLNMRLGYYTIIFYKYFKIRERVIINHTYKLFIYLFICYGALKLEPNLKIYILIFNID